MVLLESHLLPSGGKGVDDFCENVEEEEYQMLEIRSRRGPLLVLRCHQLLGRLRRRLGPPRPRRELLIGLHSRDLLLGLRLHCYQ